MNTERSIFDVAVIGGGPSGAASAATLARLGRKVILMEQSGYDSAKVGETLAPTIRPLLIQLGIWSSFIATNPMPSFGIKSAWGSNDLMSSSSIFSPYGPGWHIDRQQFDKMMSEVAAKEGAFVLINSRTTEFISDPEIGWIIKFSRQKNQKGACNRNGFSCTDTSFHAKAIINATGRSSMSLQRFGAQQIHYDQLVGVAVRFQTTGESPGGFTLVEASENGWWYSAPLPKNVLIVVFITDADIMAQNCLNRVETWTAYLNQTEHTRTRCSGYSLLSGPKVFSASSQRLIRFGYEYKWLAVGDAALAVDPLSASGIDFAVRSGRNGAKAMDLWLSGDSCSARTYDEQVDKEFDKYFRLRSEYYSLEARWPDSQFWRRRSVIKVT